MDKPDNESLLCSKSNSNLENIRKVYANGGISMAEILSKMDLNYDFESMAMAAHSYIPPDLLDKSSGLEHSLKETVKQKNSVIPTIYIPGKVFFTDTVDSCLTKRQQATCLNALKLKQNGHEFDKLSVFQKQDILQAMELQNLVQEENAKFMEYVKNDWNTHQRRALTLKASLKSYAYTMWQRKLKHVLDYPRFYKQLNVLPFSCQESESEIYIQHAANLHEVGTVPKFVKPCLELRHLLKVSSLPLDDPFVLGSKLSVSEDPTVSDLVKTTPVDIVISSSGLKQLMDDTNSNNEWTIPVVVKKHNAESDNVEKSIVYIDKPAAKRFPSSIDCNYYCQKLLVKTNFCCYPGITYNSTDVQIPSNTSSNFEHKDVPEEREPLSKSKCSNYAEELEQFSKLLEHSKSGGEVSDLPAKRKIFHNASYRVWSMKPKEQNELLKVKHTKKDLKILIRCKLDACERLEDGSVRPLVIVPKLEYQVEHGATIPTKKEIIDQWTALFFRPFSNLYRVRIQSNNLEIVDVQNVSLQKLNNEASMFHNYKPHLRLDILYEIFCSLTDLKPGSYLLRYCANKGPFIQVYTECDGTLPSDRFNFHYWYSNEVCSLVIPNTPNVPWTPIDPSYILPVHTTFKRMPGMFRPLIKEQRKRGKKKKKNKKKNKRLQNKS